MLNIFLIGLSTFFIVYGLYINEIMITVSSLAVLAATISGLVATLVLKSAKDRDRPYIIFVPNNDRYSILQLEIKNIGSTVAIIDGVEANASPKMFKGENLFEQFIGGVISPGESIKYPLTNIRDFKEKIEEYNLAGTIKYRDILGKSYDNSFLFKVNHLSKTLKYDDEYIKALYKVQQIPDEIRKIEREINRSRQLLNNSNYSHELKYNSSGSLNRMRLHLKKITYDYSRK